MPESMNYVGTDNAGHAENIPDGPTFCLMAEQAKKHHVWLHCGSIYEKNEKDPRPYNATMVISRRENWRPNTIKYTLRRDNSGRAGEQRIRPYLSGE